MLHVIIHKGDRMPSQEFSDLMKELDELHKRKSHDYSHETNPFSNFERASVLISWFNDPIDQVFAGIIGIKLARLSELSNGKEPNNESIDDSFSDLTCYCGLWTAYRRRKTKQTNAQLLQ